MKKKIINGLLMMALVVSTTSSFVSCKDTVGDDNARFEELFYQQNDYMKSVLLVQITNLRTDLTTLQNLYGTDISKILNLNTVNNGNGGYLGEVAFLQKYKELLDILESMTKGVDIPGTGAGGSGTTQNLSQWIAAVNQMLNDLAGQGDENATSIKDLLQRVKALEAAVTALQTQVNTNTGDIASIKSQLLTISTALNTLTNTVTTELNTIKERLTLLENKVDNLNYMNPDEVNNLINDLKAKFGNYYTKEEVDVIKNTFNGYYTKEDIENIKQDIETSLGGKADKATIDAMKKEIDEKFGNYYTKEEIDAMKKAIEDRIASLESHKVYVDTRLKNISDSLATAYTKLAQANEEIASIKKDYATKQALADSIAKLRSEIIATQGVSQEYVDALVKALNDKFDNYFTKSEIQTELSKYYTQEQINNMLNGYYTKEQIDNMLTKYFTKEDAEKLQNSIDQINTTIGNMQTDIKNLQDEDEAIKERLTNLENSVKDLTDRVDAIESNVSKIFDAIDKQVTGIIVQGAYSPVFGIGMLPVDAKTNILAAYVGQSVKAIEFPATNANNYVNQSEFWITKGEDKETPFIDFAQAYTNGAGKVLLSDATDNAGKLYLTVNPSQVDFEGKILEMENSQGKAAPIALSPLKKSDFKLSFGWTRAAQNGFYEADAMITEADLKDAKARINTSALVAAAKDLYHTRSKASLKEVAQAILTATDGDILDANAAKATYEGVNDKGELENKTTFSEYSVATTVITPLSYNTLKDFNPNRIPGLDRVESVINRLFNSINVNFNFGIKAVAQMPQIDLITIPELDKEYYINVHIKQPIELKDIPVNVPGQWVEVKVDKTLGSSVHVEIPYQHLDYTTPDPDDYITETLVADVPYDVPIKFDEKVWVEGTTVYFTYTYNLDVSQNVDITDIIKDLYGEVTQPIDGVNETLKSLQKFADEVNEMLKSVQNLDARVNGQINDLKNSIKNQIIGYMDKFEKKVLSYVPYVHQALQPVLLYATASKGLARVSKFERGATKMSGTVMFAPTTYNAELLSPAFKKYVVCTGAWDANGKFDATAAKAANADAANENFAKVIDGAERTVTFTGKAGYKYRIVYQALDYHGMIASGRYYVQF